MALVKKKDKQKKEKKVKLKAIEQQLLNEMAKLDPKSQEYGVLAQRYKLIEEARKESGATKSSGDTAAKAALTLATTGLVLAVDRNSPIGAQVTKLLGLIPKPKIF